MQKGGPVCESVANRQCRDYPLESTAFSLVGTVKMSRREVMSEKREPCIGSSQQAKENKCASDLLCLDTFFFAHMQSHKHASPCDIHPCMTEHMHLCSHCSEVHWLTARLKLFQETATCLSRSRILSSPC